MAPQTIRLGTMEFEWPLIVNAGGTLKNWNDLPALLGTSLQIILYGAMLLPIRAGNPGGIPATLFVDEWRGIKVSYNRLGLPEKYGAGWYEQNLASKNQLVADHGKVLAVNIAGFSVGELARLAEICHGAGIRIIFLVNGALMLIGLAILWFLRPYISPRMGTADGAMMIEQKRP